MGLSANAVRAVHKLFPRTQSDGTTVMLYTNGNGHLAFYTTADDQVVVQNDKGMFCYAELKNGELVPTSVVAHNVNERSAAEKEFVSKNLLKPTDKALEKYFVEKRATESLGGGPMKSKISSTEDGLGKYGTSALGAIPSIGNIKIPVIMVEFSDMKFADGHDQAKISRFMNEEGYCEESNTMQKGSVRDYFVSQSRGAFTPDFDVVAKVTLNNKYSYYGANSSTRTDVRSFQMFRDAVSAAISQGVDFDKYEIKYSIPNVIILYAGYGEATGGDPETIWPHELDLTTGYNTVGNYIFGSYFMGNELSGSTGTQLMGMGVMVHELSHAMGLPDIYETNYKYQNTDQPMGVWSVMDGGEYYPGTTAYSPVGYNAYERSFMGWLNIRELKDAESVVLTSEADNEGEFAVMVRNPSESKEYFILENREPATWFPETYGTGLLMYRIAYDRSAWNTNDVNTYQDKKRAMVITASGRKMTGDGLKTDLFGNGVNYRSQFPLFNGGNLSGAAFYKVLKNEDGKLTFNYKDNTLATAYVVSNDDVYEKITDVNSLKVNDKIIFVNAADGVAMSTNILSNVRGAVAVKLDGDKVYGNSLVMPFTLLQSKSGGWGFRSSSNTYLSASVSGLTMVSKATANSIANISFVDGNASVVFTGTSARNTLGYNVDETNFSCYSEAVGTLQIYRKTSTTGIDGVYTNAVDNKSNAVYNLAGQKVGDDYKGIVIVNGKKILRK